jgi:uncharacterized protein
MLVVLGFLFMDFDYRKFTHLLALFLIIVSIFVILILPVLSFFDFFPSISAVEYPEMNESIRLMLELFTLFVQLFITFLTFILFPILWYLLVNSISFKKALLRMRITLENIDIAFLWGILTVALILAITFFINFLLQQSGADLSDLSNIPDLEALFSPAILLFLVAVMPVAEEIFFRGFLMEKFESFAGKNFAIVLSSVLFGVAHMGYGKIYPAVLPIIIGLLLGYIVIKTKNLFAAIIAHVTFNVIVLVLYFAFKSFI